jgi:predicted lipid-binding transport protein (Tim44 family)
MKLMNKLTVFLTSLCVLAMLIISVSDASAARLGGGKSFGSRPSYSTPYQRSPGMDPGYSRPASPQSPAYGAAQAKNQAARDALGQRGGLARFLGGMALGGLLGAMFFGGGFEHINFLDILIFAGVAFLLFRLLASRRSQGPVASTQQGYYEDRSSDASPAGYQRQSHEPGPGFDTDILSRKGSVPPSAQRPVLPEGFDADDFLEGAKRAYGMLQKAWDDGELADLRALTTDKVFGELQDQIRSRGDTPNQTDLLKVEAELLEVRDYGNNREVTVLFDVLMRESPEAHPAQVREVWHFIRANNSRQPTWFLDGIQQLAE